MEFCDDRGERLLGEKRQKSWKDSKQWFQAHEESHSGDGCSLDHHSYAKPEKPWSGNRALGTSGIQMDC